jgi:peptidoglycan/xylan/chitin deacetylase (PgdA/CDA1 family)
MLLQTMLKGSDDIAGPAVDSTACEQAVLWTVGVYPKGVGVHLEPLGNEAEARARYNELHGCSKVLFNAEGMAERCITAWWDPKGIGVATLLHVYESGGDDVPSKEDMSKALSQGRVAFVPAERLGITQLANMFFVHEFFGRRTVTHFGSEPYRYQSLCFFNADRYPAVRKHVALTIDDAPCRFGPSSSELPRVLELLQRHGAKATFMMVGGWCTDQHTTDIVSLLRDGHELGNHGMLDRPYHQDSKSEFGAAVDECSEKICSLQRSAGVPERVRWFRAPHGKYTKAMADELETRGLTNVMCDTYASCPIVQDGEFIGRHLTERTQDGSIILIHMPEKGVREWCLVGLTRLLQGLEERNFKVVTVGELARLAEISDRTAT